MRRLRIALVVEAMDTGVAQLVYLLASGLDARLRLQLHKYIWGPDARGV